MKYFTIKALYAGQLKVPKSVGAGGNVDADMIIDFPFTCFLLRNGEENILVDTGMKHSFLEKMMVGDDVLGDTKYLIEGLAEEGLTPDDITSVIYTHLHYDHCGNGDLFTKVPNYIQKDEIANLMNPYDFQQARMDYFIEETVEWLSKVETLVQVDGDVTLANGLELFKTMGHSLGHQSIVVPTAKGKYVLCGDVPDLVCSLFPKTDKMTLMDGSVIDITPVTNQRFITSAFINDIFGTYDSHYKQLAKAERPEPEFFITSHDPGNIHRKYWG